MTIDVYNPSRMTFIHVPKNAGTSIAKWLMENANGKLVKAKHMTVLEYKKRHARDIGFTFGVVRNPWDRVASSYYYNRKVMKERLKLYTSKDFVLKVGKKKMGIEDIQWWIHFLNKGFDNYIEFGIKYWHPISTPQHVFLENVDHVLRYETLDKDFEYIQDVFNNYTSLGMHNTSKNKNWRNLYNHKTKDKVFKTFKKDIKLYGYDF